MITKKKHINLKEAREISKIFCKDFDIPYCEIYFVDRIGYKYLGLYISPDPSHILIYQRYDNRLVVLIHELIHHLDARVYTDWEIGELLDHSSRGYVAAKKRVIRWCEKNISKRIEWKMMLKARSNIKELIDFRL